ncbi:putative transcriptional regulator [Microlunatus phosphovorus NM-1]|uniref:Putative transcriptional regulator n=1 Tax=Microlunatus phosphovorus (strain ATCC 700054 / DSM 10555 / JCM 9379 / NBRC 101784 / NCIMB 13414 / VKM Ac-1990 / NM-1) TaxID=1032480 RepID=F5XN93_MICPN|nr:putative transcriptional regulator [Microlunatus phosphovorus NM-1]
MGLVSAASRPADRRQSPIELLTGFRVGVTSDRRSQDLISALERRGAEVLHAPALKIAPHDQDTILVAETRALIEARPEVVLITTGYGMRRWLEVADTVGLGARLTEVLEDALILARGPKSVGAIRAAGLEEEAASASDTTASLIDAVHQAGLTGRRVAIQLHGYTDEIQLARLRDLSARVWTVTPYRWVPPAAPDRLTRLIEATCARHLDAVTFTSAPGAEATVAVAREIGLLDEFVAALETDVLAVAVGPVTAGPLRDAGATVLAPDRHRLGALIRLVSEELAEHRVRRLRCGAAELELRGGAVLVDGRLITLSPNAFALLRTLAGTEGVARRADLQRCLPDGTDEHALDVAISRLRRSLGVPGLVKTVVKRGYRLGAVR